MCVCIHIYVCICLCTYVYICISVYIRENKSWLLTIKRQRGKKAIGWEKKGLLLEHIHTYIAKEKGKKGKTTTENWIQVGSYWEIKEGLPAVE